MLHVACRRLWLELRISCDHMVRYIGLGARKPSRCSNDFDNMHQKAVLTLLMSVKIVSDFTVDSTWSCSSSCLRWTSFSWGGDLNHGLSVTHLKAQIRDYSYYSSSKSLRSPRKLSKISFRCSLGATGPWMHWVPMSKIWLLFGVVSWFADMFGKETLLKNWSYKVASEKKRF